MNLKTLTCVSTMDHPGIHQLERSLKKFQYDYLIMVDPALNWAWGGMPNFYKWCKEQTGYTHFLYTDGFDTLALGGPEEIIAGYEHPDSFTYGAEKGCYPIVEWEKHYPPLKGNRFWRFLNGGGFITPIDFYIKYFERHDSTINCQQWGTQQYLFQNEQQKIKLDTECRIFQTIAFESPGEFSYKEERLINNYTGTKPVIIHGNGRTDMEHIYKLLK